MPQTHVGVIELLRKLNDEAKLMADLSITLHAEADHQAQTCQERHAEPSIDAMVMAKAANKAAEVRNYIMKAMAFYVDQTWGPLQDGSSDPALEYGIDGFDETRPSAS